jgi:hypothetical protein
MVIGKSISRTLFILVLISSLSNLSWVPGPHIQTGPALSLLEEQTAGNLLEVEQLAAVEVCTDSVTSDAGNALDECQGTTFTMDGETWALSVYYTLDTDADNDWISSDAQAVSVVGWMQDAYEAYFSQNGKTYGASVCGRHIRAKLMDSTKWNGIAYWPNNCFIGLRAEVIRNDSGRHVTMHEMRHKGFQFTYPNCLSDWKPDYSTGTVHYIVEGDADYGPTTVGDFGRMNSGYDPNKSLKKHGYNNLFTPYYSEHVDLYTGPWGSPGDPDYLAGGMVAHWDRCEAVGDIHVVRDVVQTFTPYSMEQFFLNFFATLYLYSYADPATQPELYFFETDAPGINLTYSPPIESSVPMSTGSTSWTSESTPDTWAGKYYEVIPQAGCEYIMLEGSGSGTMGWAFMAANTGTPRAEYSGWVGSQFSRVFAAHGAHNKIGIAAVGFGHNRTYSLTATCVTPQIKIKRPLKPNFVANVGDPLSPVGFMAYIEVTDGAGTPVTGIPPDWFVLDAEGDAVTTNTVSEITKGHYFGVFLPPNKPVETNWVDLQACLGSSGICTTNNEALHYIPPGNMDMVLLHDASGSMSYIDVPGDFSRLEQAKHAAELLVMLAQTGDYYGIMDFSARDIDRPGETCPPGCVHDVKVIYPKTEITNPSSQIPAMRAAISGMTAREWTNLGEGLRQAQILLLGPPFNDNNKVTTVLSDGEENVTPKYDDVANDMEVEINTMGFSGDAPDDLLARIADENGGNYLYVPTSPGSALANPEEGQSSLAVASILTELTDQGISEAQALQFVTLMSPNSTYLPGGLGLREAYDYRQAEAIGASRILYQSHLEVPLGDWRYESTNVSAADNMLNLVSSSTEADYGGSCGWLRDVDVLPAGSDPRDWIPISPTNTIPPNWDVRNSPYHDVLYVSDPEPGEWQIRTRMRYILCLQSSDPQDETSSPAQLEGNFLQAGKVLSTIKVEGQILLENNQGRVGDPVPLLGIVLTRAGAAPGALVLALVERPGGDSHLLWLRDNGQFGDGAAADGIYGNTYTKAVIGGTYNVTIGAIGTDPFNPDQLLVRFWKGSFYMEGIGPKDDLDDDRIPDWWERKYPCMDPEKFDANVDYDQDGLTNWQEWLNGTDPCNPDTDGGGELDGSEVTGERNPHWPGDDMVPPIENWFARPLNQAILIRWSQPTAYTRMLISIGFPDGHTETHEGGTSGSFLIPLPNNKVYAVTLQGETADGVGAPTEPMLVEPRTDPDPPSGDILINNGVETTSSLNVELIVLASDEPVDGPISLLGGALNINTAIDNTVSGGVEMRFRNEETGTWSEWQPYAKIVPWTLSHLCRSGRICTVYGQFRDAALNESVLVVDTIKLVGGELFLPLVLARP